MHTHWIYAETGKCPYNRVLAILPVPGSSRVFASNNADDDRKIYSAHCTVGLRSWNVAFLLPD